MDDRVYHYTSLDAMLSILQGIDEYKEYTENDGTKPIVLYLRATHISFLNDATEGKIYPEALEYLGLNTENMFNLAKPHIISFSKAKDRLSMWRGYARNGSGVMLEFDKTGVETSIKDFYSKKTFGTDHFDCTYTTAEKLINEVEIPQSDKDKYYALSNSAKYKHEAFNEECEYRISIGTPPREDKFYIRNGVIVPYIDIAIRTECLKEIMLGPGVDKDKTQYAIQSILKRKLGEDCTFVEITKSQIPFINN